MKIGRDFLRLRRETPVLGLKKKHRKSLFEVELARHDFHNLELKTSFGFRINRIYALMDIALFVPASLRMKELGRDAIVSDFESRLRVGISKKGSKKQRLTMEHHFSHVIGGLGEQTEEEVQSSLRGFGGILGEWIKKQLVQQKTRIQALSFVEDKFTEQSLDALMGVTASLRETSGWIQKTRDALKSSTLSKLETSKLLSDYMTHLYFEYLGVVSVALDEFVRSTPTSLQEDSQAILGELEDVVSGLRKHEITNRSEKILDLETHMVKVSQLKKYFQSEMFIDVSRKNVAKRFSEPIAAMGAATAAVVAAFLRSYSDPAAMRVGYDGLTIVVLGIGLYVVRDRLKDKFKGLFANSFAKVFPDRDVHLVVNGDRLGKIREWFRISNRPKLPEKMQALRAEAYITGAERSLPEDVFFLHREVSLNGKQLQVQENGYSLNEVLRINLERYLKYMDDPFKTLKLLGDDGRFNEKDAKKVYYFYLAVRGIVSHRPLKSRWGDRKGKPLRKTSKIYRVVLSKQGIERIDSVQAAPSVILNS